MNKYKVCVYAICKNEEKFVSRWVKSMSEADEIYVLDTGSTDNTVKFLKDLGVHVQTQMKYLNQDGEMNSKKFGVKIPIG